MDINLLINYLNQNSIQYRNRNNVVSTNPHHLVVNPYHSGVVTRSNPYHSRVVTRSNPYHSRVVTRSNHNQKKAFVCIKTTSGRFLVVRHNFKKKWMLPGGLCNHNEDYRTTALRETREEWGGSLNNLTHLYTTPDNAAIFLSTYNFRNTTHDERVNIFRNRTTPNETSDYGFYNPITGNVESYSGLIKPNQNFLGIALYTIKNVRSNYKNLL